MPQPASNSRRRAWCFTLNNWTAHEVTQLTAAQAAGTPKYVCFGKEVGEAGTPHLQGVFQLTVPKSLTAIKAMGAPFDRMHLEPMKGTWAQAIAYCGKEQPVTHLGAIPAPGARSDLQAAVEAAEAGLNRRDALAEGAIRSFAAHRGYNALRSDLGPRPDKYRCMKVMWLWGPTGVGKSVFATEALARASGGRRPYPVTRMTDIFWMGYNEETTCIVDDISEVTEACLQTFNQAFGGLDCDVRVSGGAVPCRVQYAVITSHHSPQELLARGHLDQRWAEVCRRCTAGVFRLCAERPLATMEFSADGIPSPHITPLGEWLAAKLSPDAPFSQAPPLPMAQAFGPPPSHALPAEADLPPAEIEIPDSGSEGE